MITIERVGSIPEDVRMHLTGEAQDDLRKAEGAGWRGSRMAWVARSEGRPLWMVGLVRRSWVGTGAELWFLLCDERMTRKSIRFAKKGLHRLLGRFDHVCASVRRDFAAGHRWARFFGFVPTCASDDYIWYEARR